MRDPKINLDSLAIRFDYILIIEYLSKDERKTGEELFTTIRAFAPKSVEFNKCINKSEFFAAINQAREEVKSKGIPWIHIESHGSQWDKSQKNAWIGFKGGDYISIHEIFKLLRPLNIETNFNVALAGASCYGAEYLRGIVSTSEHEDQQSLPFVATVGFDDAVQASSIFAFYSNLYREIIVDNVPLINAIDSSQKLVQEVAIVKYSKLEIQKQISSISIDNEANHLIEKVSKNHGEKLDFNRAKNLVIDSIQLMISRIFAYKELPQNRERFDIKITN